MVWLLKGGIAKIDQLWLDLGGWGCIVVRRDDI